MAAAVLSALAVTVTALPGVAHAAPGDTIHIIGGKRCDEKWLGKPYDRTPPNSGIPQDQYYSTNPRPDRYVYDNPAKAFDNLPGPSADEQAEAGNTDADVEKWDKRYEKTGDVEDKRKAIYARYGRHLDTAKNPTRDFSRWLDRWYIGNEVNNKKGAAFEARMVRQYSLIGPDWLCQVKIELRDKNGKVIATRDYDTYNKRTTDLGEFKSNGKHINKQLVNDRKILAHPDMKNARLNMFSGARTADNTLKKYKQLDEELRRARGTQRPQVKIRERIANGIPAYERNTYSKNYQVMNPRPGTGTFGPLNDAAWRSGKTPEEAKILQRQYEQNNARGAFMRGPGGVDFSTLELQYVGNPVKGKGLDYSMKAGYMPDPDTDPGWGGEAKMQLVSDSFFTWLALTPDKFWVNLNPDQPDRILDDAFASTDAGRILLEADLRMKHDFYKAMDPSTDLGRRYWAALPKENGYPCMPSLRNWIEPKPAKVREQDGGIYILDAPLRLQSTAESFSTPGAGEPICTPDETQTRQAQAIIDSMIVPAVEKQINTESQYADLRRVYKSRVAAEWVRQQDAAKPTDFRSIINSNNVKRWPLRAPNDKWNKNDLYERYVQIFKNGEFRYNVDTDHGVQIYIVGGVDFSKSPKRNITRVEFSLENPRLDTTTSTSTQTETGYGDTQTAFLGGGGSEKNPGKPDPKPTPTPTEPDPSPSKPDDDSSPTPSTPAPAPSDNGKPPAKEPDGDLADTGSDTPVGLLAALAATLAAGGAGLTWWMRRRRRSATN
ncbi:hypothetical protein [Streptomyces sp. DSM 40750]|uniref:hypothetical protein n=1 Tax=Streptomyces sp. DSM 40750 TaxID=2801030 RepID=UPI00214CE8B1|nr:hypothetical protein [Streptomyces sp. DSM 40750]UUU22254.1 hypothetical protein JIX55_19130 [Streptomyces sp. DSM 40750]